MIRNQLDIIVARLRRAGLRGASTPRNRTGAFSSLLQLAMIYSFSISFAVIISLMLPGSSMALNPANGDIIINNAALSTLESPPFPASVAVTVALCSKSAIEFHKYAPGASSATSYSISNTYYGNGFGNFTMLPPLLPFGPQQPIDLNSVVPLTASTLFHAGEPLFVKVVAHDQNMDRAVTEMILVNIFDSKTGDMEVLRITETGPDSGIFIGYIQTATGTSSNTNGVLTVAEASYINADFVDSCDSSTVSADAALVDPYGIVFDTLTGKPIDGATVELINATTGAGAIVYGDNGSSSNIFPNKIISGSTATDSDGNIYSFTPGGYRFPYVATGNYILKVTPPDNYNFPSKVSTAKIQALPGAPFVVVDPGSRGELFIVPVGPAIHIDIPLDPISGSLWLRKSAGKSIVSPGEFLSYEINLENNDAVGTLFSTKVTDRLPPGFRYQKGSTRINAIPAVDPSLSPDGRTMTFAVGDIGPNTTLTIRYVVAVGAGAKAGDAVNTATASTTPAVAVNKATAVVRVQEPFMTSRSIIMGRVVVGTCGENIDDNKKGMEGIGIYLEDGTFVFSDKLGMFHFEGVRSGTHVVQLDLDSIPEGYKILPCEQNSRFAGRAYSQFVDLQGGTMWRTDFYLGRIELSHPSATASKEKSASIGKGTETEAAVDAKGSQALPSENYKGEISLEMISSQNGEFINYQIPLQSATVPLTNLHLDISLPPGAIYIKGSSSLEGAIVADPETSAGRLLYDLGSAGTDWHKELRFRVAIDRKAQGGELLTKGLLTFDTTVAKGIAAPSVDNILSLVKEESNFALPPIVVRPKFPTFGAELNEADRKQLDEMALLLSRFKIDRIDVAGHTDIVRIAPRSRHIYTDNTALSFARARSVGRYLTAALHLPPEKLYLTGSGEKSPIATNKTADGRALNRRVEVKVSAAQTIETNHLKIIKERSGQKKQQTSGGPLSHNPDTPVSLTPPKPVKETVVAMSAENASESIIQDEVLQPSKASLKNSSNLTSASQKMNTASQPEKNKEGVELISALSEGIIHYRIKLVGIKDSLKNVTVTIVTPKSFLYMAGTSRLSGTAAPEPTTNESLISYAFTSLKDDRKFDLRLQTLLDSDDQKEFLSSSVSVVIADSDGKQLKTYTATADLSDSMDEINRPDFPATAEESSAQDSKEKAASEAVNEFIEKVTVKNKGTKGNPANQDTGLHVKENEGILSPSDGTVVATQINAVRIVLNSALTPVLTLDNKEISSERIVFSISDRESGKSLYTYIGVDFGKPGEHVLHLTGKDSFGLARFDSTAKITRAGEITSIKLVSAEGNVADGKTPVKVKVQLFDKNNKLVMADAELAVKGGDLQPVSTGGIAPLAAGTNNVSVSSDGLISFRPVTNSGLYRTQLAYNKATLDIETYIKPKMRDWILVGLAEGTAGYNTVSGNIVNLKSAGQEEQLYDKERLALYTKGTIKGEWLLTMAYDSAKKNTGVGGNGLFQTIDPNSYYTIYGDASSQLYDAASQKKLYLKIERDQFYAMFGDYDTGLTVTELSRYSRRMNGLKSEFHSRNYDVSAFGSETGQSFVKDELRGDGTSGLYRLSKTGIVINSEKVIVETRDRFHSEIITDSKPMTRFIDYHIDYDTGAIFFKSPVQSRDDKFNPVYVAVDYEISDAGKDALTYGGHAATRLMSGKVQVGGTYVHEGHISGDANLYGADATAMLAPGTKARVEFATTNDDTVVKKSGNAYLAEVTHAGKEFDGKIYYREQEDGFGLGQQNVSEAGTRKFGADAGYRINDKITLNSQGYRQYNLATGAVRDFMETLASYSEKQYSLRIGMRYANDSLPDGSNATSVLATAGGSWKTKNQQLTLRADHDQAIFSKNINTDFPTRTILGADYQATKAVLLFAQEELTYGVAENTNTTRVGVKSTPWSGGTLNSSIVNDIKENSDRTFANAGLTQKWQINPRWAFDGGFDHSETIRKKSGYTMNANVPPASGGDDFTAVSLGANYTEKKLAWSNRVEYRNSTNDDKWGIISGVVNEQGLNWGWTGRLQLLHTQSAGGNSSTNADLRFGLAYRPPVTKWIVLNRLDLIGSDVKSATSSVIGKRIINNLNANYKPDRKTQISIQYGAKYVLEQIDEKDYSGYTDLIAVEGRYDITKEWDLGLRTSLLHTWESDQYAFSFGPSVGYNVMENAWLSLGYNVVGFTDKDFSAANYTAQGPFIQYRFKFDQNSVKDGLKSMGQ